MIHYRTGSLFQQKDAVLTNTVNCVGKMGKGIAKSFKARYPEMFRDYEHRCMFGTVEPGVPYLWRYGGVTILNFPTKNHWRDPSNLEWIQSGLNWIVDANKRGEFDRIALPALGCSNGGLDWTVVESMIVTTLGAANGLTVYLYPLGSENT